MVESRPLRAEHAEATQRAIVDAARQLFGQAGYAATSIDQIAAAARVTKGAVYHHFPSKPAVFRAVYAEVEGDAIRRVFESRATATETDAVDIILRGADTYLDVALEPEVQRITLIDAPSVLGLEPEGPPEEQAGHIGMRAFVAAAMDDGTIRRLDPDAVTHLLRGAILQAAMLIARAPDPDDARRRLGAALHAMVEGLRPHH
jgi:AcrR family transcriptional regulator